MKTHWYYNATKLCSENGKRFEDFYKVNQNKELIYEGYKSLSKRCLVIPNIS